MYNATEQFAEHNQAHVAQALTLAALAVQNIDKLAKINLDTAKSALAQGVEIAQAVAAVKDIQQLATLNAAVFEANVQGLVDYSKLLYQLTTEARTQYAALIDASWAGNAKGATAWVDQISKSAPAGSEAAVYALKQGFAASTAAFDQINQVSKQVANQADASVRTAAANATKFASASKGRKAA